MSLVWYRVGEVSWGCVAPAHVTLPSPAWVRRHMPSGATVEISMPIPLLAVAAQGGEGGGGPWRQNICSSLRAHMCNKRHCMHLSEVSPEGGAHGFSKSAGPVREGCGGSGRSQHILLKVVSALLFTRNSVTLTPQSDDLLLPGLSLCDNGPFFVLLCTAVSRFHVSSLMLLVPCCLCSGGDCFVGDFAISQVGASDNTENSTKCLVREKYLKRIGYSTSDKGGPLQSCIPLLNLMSSSFRKLNFDRFGPVFPFSQVYSEALPLHIL